MEGVFRYATILLEAFDVPVSLATLYLLMEGHVRVSELHNLHFVLPGAKF